MPEPTPIHLFTSATYASWLENQPDFVRNWLSAIDFKAEPNAFALVPDAQGELNMVVAGMSDPQDMWAVAGLADKLPTREYVLANADNVQAYALGWALGAYRFKRYKKAKPVATLALDTRTQQVADAVNLARDLINTPANDMLPTQLSEACAAVADTSGAQFHVLIGQELLTENYPTIYTVGKASADAPRLIDIRWGREDAPKVTLVGKGVCFDSGGLDIKSTSGMRLMKKDMGGAAIVLGLAQLIMQRRLDVRLRLLIPAVENAVGGHAMRPLDVVRTRKGITVEIGNTDAEGRLILSDALAEADNERPDLLIDCTTLTGAARVALGTDLPAFFTPDDVLAEQFSRACAAQHDPAYRLPLVAAYRDMLKSNVADLSNDTDSSYAGAITAALFLKEFVEHTPRWLHLDMMAWNVKALPGRPAGAEAQCLRALFALLEERYG